MANPRSSMGRNRNSSGKGILIFSAVALLAAGGAGAWYFLRPKAVTPPPALEATKPAESGLKPAPAAPEAPLVTAPPSTATTKVEPAKSEAPKTAAAPVTPPAAGTPAPGTPTAAPATAFVPVAAPAALTPQTGNIQKELEQGVALIDGGKVVEGRAILSEVLFNYTAELKPENAAWIRAKLTEINSTYAYGKRNLTGDDITAIHTVKSGEALEKIANKYRVPSGLLLQISGMKSAKSLQMGQKLKTILGPIHARVVKHEYRLDLYAQNANGAKIYLKSFPVGLGVENKTPTGKFRIGVLEGDVLRGKMDNPTWSDPETGQKFAGGAADNPIGKFWIPLQGQEPTNANFTGYGIHGTIDPSSIGQNKSHGCVRLVEADIQEVYHTLFCGKSVFSTLEILP